MKEMIMEVILWGKRLNGVGYFISIAAEDFDQFPLDCSGKSWPGNSGLQINLIWKKSVGISSLRDFDKYLRNNPEKLRNPR